MPIVVPFKSTLQGGIMNDVTVFTFNQNQVRTIIKNGEPWFVAKDVCDVLEINNDRQALVRIPEQHKGVSLTDTLGGKQRISVISESGLYRLVLRSDKPQAEPFIEWVTSEVLPTIRKTGAYVLPRSELLNKEVAAREFAALKAVAELCGLEGNAAIVSADNAIRREHGISLLQTLQIELKNPDQKYFFSPTQIAEMLHLSGPREVNKLLEIGGYQVKSGGQWLPTEKGKVHAVLLDTGKRHSSGVMIQQLKWKETVLDVLK